MHSAPFFFLRCLPRKRYRNQATIPRFARNDTDAHESGTVVVAIVPIAVVVPTMAVFVPPTMVLAPAALTCFPQLMALVFRLPTVPAVSLDGFVQFVVFLGDAALALIVGVFMGRSARRCREGKQSDKSRGGERRPSPEPFLSRKHNHLFSSVLYSPTGMGFGPGWLNTVGRRM